MPVNRRKRVSRRRGSHTHGWGSKKKHRGAGNRGGTGMASTGKRSDAFKPSIWKEDYFGKHGFFSRRAVKHKGVNVEYLDNNIERLVKLNLAKQENSQYLINIADLGYDKLLGKGKVTRKLVITADYASAGAVEAVKSAGGEVRVSERSVKV